MYTPSENLIRGNLFLGDVLCNGVVHVDQLQKNGRVQRFSFNPFFVVSGLWNLSFVFICIVSVNSTTFVCCIKDRVIEEMKTTSEKKEWDTKDYCSFAKDLIPFESLSYCDFVICII